jgi:xylulokinase
VENVVVIDAGTSSIKAVLIDRSGAVAASSAVDLAAALSPEPGWSEQDPEIWWRAAIAAARGLAFEAAPVAFALTGAMQNVILLDRQGAAVRPAILYNDARVGERDIGRPAPLLPDDFERIIGNHAMPALCLYRLAWLLKHEPAAMARCAALLFGSKDFLIQKMTGRAIVDPTTASTTGMMALAERRWAPAIVAALGLSHTLLPDILAADAPAGPLTESAAAALGLPAGIPVFVGSGDVGATAWGACSEAHDRPHAYLGTTGWISATMPLAQAAPPREAYCLAAPVGRDVIVVSPFLAAGLAIDWFADIAGQSVAALYAEAEQRDATPPQTLFLPYLIGERAPFADRAVRGAFLGLDSKDDAPALAYAVLEGLAHAIRDNLDALPIAPKTIALAGGVAGSLTVARLIADVTGCDVIAPGDSRIVTAYGAWRLIAPRLGFGASAAVVAGARIAPRPERIERARRRFAAYREAAANSRALAISLAD